MQTLSPIPECVLQVSTKEEGNISSYEDLMSFSSQWKDKTPYLPSHRHGTDIVYLTDAVVTAPPASGDIVVTNSKQVVVAHQFADCVPVVCIDRKKKAFVFSHLGWKGLTIGGVHISILSLCAFAQSDMSDVWVWIGPCIQKTSYRFEQKPLQAGLPTWEKAVQSVEDSEKQYWSIDLPGFIMGECSRIGIDPAQVISDGRDTYTMEEMFFSHKRSVDTKEPSGSFIVSCYLK